jgi:hypothetical protein
MKKVDITDNIFKIEIRNLKSEFLGINDYYIGKPLTMVLMEEINNRYYDLFESFDLRDLQWRLIKHENKVEFLPIRPIDKYTINGIINS